MEKKNNRLGKIIVLLILLYLIYMFYKKVKEQSSNNSRSANTKPNKLYIPPVITPNPQDPGGGGTPPVIDNNYPLAVSAMANFALETTQNTLNLNDLEEIDLPPLIKAVSSIGTPSFTNWSGQGELKLFKIGQTHFGNNDCYRIGEVQASTKSQFVGMTSLIDQVATELQGAYPDLANVATRNFGAVSRESRLVLGQYCYYKRSTARSFETGLYDRPADGNYFLLDEEQYTWMGDANSFVGEVYEGWYNTHQSSLKMNYGWIGNGWWVYKGVARYPDYYTDAEIEAMPGEFLLTHPSHRASRSYMDMGLYFKIPVVKSTIYEKDGSGNYVLENGLRKFRTDTFKETIFGRTFDILAEPTGPYLQYSASNLPDPAQRPHEVIWMLRQLYRLLDNIIINMQGLSKIHYNDFDISRWRELQLKPGIVMRLLAEAWTYGGYDHRYREIGEAGILYWVLFALFSGVESIEDWEIGYNGNPLRSPGEDIMQIKPEGQPLYPTPGYSWDIPQNYWNPGEPFSETQPGNDNHSRHKVYLGAVNSFARIWRDCGFAHNNSLRFVRFNQPIYSIRNYETLCTGIYQGSKLALVIGNPTLDENDVQKIELKAGATTHRFSIKSRKPIPLVFDVPAGLEPSEFTLKYTTLFNKDIHVTGLINPSKSGHYLS